MRQFVLGLLVAAFVWWGYGSFAGKPAEAGSPEGSPAGANGAGVLQEVLNGGAGAQGSVAKGATPETALSSLPGGVAPAASNPAAPLPAVSAATVQAVLDGLAGGDAASRQLGWSLLAAAPSARGAAFSGAERARLVAALTPAAADFASMLSQLGSTNAFLHSAEGREQAGKVFAVAMAMRDAEAVKAGSQFLTLCLCGSIRREDTTPRAFVDQAYGQHRVRVDRHVCDPANVQGSRSYTVQKGDSLARIASKFRREKIFVEDGTLAILNRIHNPSAIQVGQKIKVPVDPIVTVLEKRSYGLAVYVGDSLLRLYWVGHGEHDKTPLAEFTIIEKQERPDWTAPNGQLYGYGQPENILGEYFVKLQHDSHTGFGLHGTPQPETICTMSSAGCIRMLAPDIAEVFKLLPRGTKVVVRATGS